MRGQGRHCSLSVVKGGSLRTRPFCSNMSEEYPSMPQTRTYSTSLLVSTQHHLVTQFSWIFTLVALSVHCPASQSRRHCVDFYIRQYKKTNWLPCVRAKLVRSANSTLRKEYKKIYPVPTTQQPSTRGKVSTSEQGTRTNQSTIGDGGPPISLTKSISSQSEQLTRQNVQQR